MENEAEAFITEFLDQFADQGTGTIIHDLSVDHDVLVTLVYHMSYMPYVGLTKRHVEAVSRLGLGLITTSWWMSFITKIKADLGPLRFDRL
jgi:hypothetical protein